MKSFILSVLLPFSCSAFAGISSAPPRENDTELWFNNSLSFRTKNNDTGFNTATSTVNLAGVYGHLSTGIYYQPSVGINVANIAYSKDFGGVAAFASNLTGLDQKQQELSISLGGGQNLTKDTLDYSELGTIHVNAPGVIQIYQSNKLVRSVDFESNNIDLSAYRDQLTPDAYLVIVDKFKKRKTIKPSTKHEIKEGLTWLIKGVFNHDPVINGELGYSYSEFGVKAGLGMVNNDCVWNVSTRYSRSGVVIKNTLLNGAGGVLGNAIANVELSNAVNVAINYGYGGLGAHAVRYQALLDYNNNGLVLTGGIGRTTDNVSNTSASVGYYVTDNMRVYLHGVYNSNGEYSASFQVSLNGSNDQSDSYKLDFSHDLLNSNNNPEFTMSGGLTAESRYIKLTGAVSQELHKDGKRDTVGYMRMEDELRVNAGGISFKRS